MRFKADAEHDSMPELLDDLLAELLAVALFTDLPPCGDIIDDKSGA